MVSNRMLACAATILAAVGLSAASAAGEDVKVPCSRDVWVSAVGAEQDHSMGKTPQLKLKTIQEMAVLDFDLSGMKGKTVGKSWLHFHIADARGEVARMGIPLQRRHLLRGIGLSTVSTDWVEGKAAGSYTVDRAGNGATFREASGSKRPWAWPGSDLSAVIFGSGNTLQAHADLEDLPGLWARVPVPADLVRSLICRDAFGLCIMDEIGYGLANNFIHSREAKGRGPFLVVDVTGTDDARPAQAKATVRAAPKAAHLSTGAAVIEIEGPADAFCYFVTVNGTPVPRRLIPHPKNGATRILLENCKPTGKIAVEVVTCDAAGNRSTGAKASGTASGALKPPPKLPAAWRAKPGEPPVRAGGLKVWALPEICKVDPLSGALFEAKALGTDGRAYRRGNSVWDGASNSVRLFGASGEIVAFQLCLERTDVDKPLEDILLRFDGLAGAGKIPADRVRMFRIWYTPTPEYAIPIRPGQKLVIPNGRDRAPAGQKNQLIYVDVAIPQGTKPGQYAGKVTISADGVKPFDVPVRLKVYGFAIPDRMRFNPELNIYAAPGRPGSKAWFESFRVAHYNRCTLSITMAGHGDQLNGGIAMRTEGSGSDVRVSDWSRWDGPYGPLLDGSAFKDLPRASVPLASCQVPIGHGYPLRLDRYYRYGGPKKHKQVALVHALLAKPIDEAFGEDYKKGFQSFARQIARHFEAKGWTDTYFMFYLDAKVMWRIRGNGTSYWTLDEPYDYNDWVALRFWGKLFRDAVAAVPTKARWGFRCDISRPHWTHNWLGGVMTTMYVGGLERRGKAVQLMARDDPKMNFTSYGACNKPNTSNWNSAAWCLSTFLAGGDGVLPWQSLGRGDSLNKLDPYGLIIPNTAGHDAIGSVRIMALRRGAQDCEYLLTLGEKGGLTREQLRALVAAKVAPKGTLTQLHEDDAAPVTFEKLDPDKFAELREGLAKLIEAAK